MINRFATVAVACLMVPTAAAPLALALLCTEPSRWIRYMITGGVLSLARGVCIALTGLGVPDPAHTAVRPTRLAITSSRLRVGFPP